MPDFRSEPTLIQGTKLISSKPFVLRDIVLTSSTGAVSLILYNKATSKDAVNAERRFVFAVGSGESKPFSVGSANLTTGCFASLAGVGYATVGGSRKAF